MSQRPQNTLISSFEITAFKYELSQNTINGDIKDVLMAYETHFKSLNAILSYITEKEYQNLPQI